MQIVFGLSRACAIVAAIMAALLTGFSAAIASDDTEELIEVEGGGTVSGKIVSATRDGVEIDTSTGRRQIARESIKRVVRITSAGVIAAVLYSAGRRFEPAKLYSVGTPVRPPREVWAGDADVHVGVGVSGSSGTSSYDSTGGQAPFNGDWSQSFVQACGGVTFYPGLFTGPAVRLGVDVNVCSGSKTFGPGDTTLFGIMRHGPGDVVLRSSGNAVIDLLLLDAQVSLTQVLVLQQALSLKVGVGPSFRNQTLTLTSDQSFFGGGVPSSSTTEWQTGVAVRAGLFTYVCPNCIAGNPLEVGVEGRARFFPSQSISLRSPAFGFVETGSTGRTTDYSALITFGVPFNSFHPYYIPDDLEVKLPRGRQ